MSETTFTATNFKRGNTAHILVCLEDLSALNQDQFSASIPWVRADEASEIFDLQSSRSSAPTEVTTDDDQSHIAFHYTVADKNNNIRAYVPSLVGALYRCMDVQSSDGKGMLLKHVSSYVAK